MIVVALRGGIGNQLFQYAAGRSVSIRAGVPLKLDTSWYTDPALRVGLTSRAFELSHFRTGAAIASEAEIAESRDAPQNQNVLARAARKIGLRRRTGWIRERNAFEFDRTVLDAGPNAYLDGYWQNERYFAPIADKLRGEFQLAQPLSAASQRILNSIRASNSVGVHVRRGDYADGTSALHSPCNAEYYRQASEIISREIPDATIYYFSDDPAWVDSFLSNILPGNIVSSEGLPAHEELFLMSACRHQVIANSTFSWWAAWLNTHTDKIVIAPKRWLNDDRIDTSGMIPRGWRAI